MRPSASPSPSSSSAPSPAVRAARAAPRRSGLGLTSAVALAFAVAPVTGLLRPAQADNRYWVDALIGTWEDASNWSFTQNGPGGAGMPLGGDRAWFLTTAASQQPICLFTNAATTINLFDVTIGGLGNARLAMGAGTLRPTTGRIGRVGRGTVSVGGTSHLDVLDQLLVGVLAGDEGTLEVTSDGLLTAPALRVGLQGTGQLDQSGGTIDAGTISLGDLSGSFAQWALSDGVATANALRLGLDGTGSLLQTGGELAAGSVRLGDGAGASGFLVQEAGTITAGSLAMASDSGGIALATLSGGSLDVTGPITVAPAGNAGLVVDGGMLTGVSMAIGDSGQVGFAAVRLDDGLIDIAGTLRVELDGAEQGLATLTVNGGTLRAGDLDSTQDGVITQNGGLIRVDGTMFLGGPTELLGGVTVAGEIGMSQSFVSSPDLRIAAGADVRVPLLNADRDIRIEPGSKVSGGYLGVPFHVYLRGEMHCDGEVALGGDFIGMNVHLSPSNAPSEIPELLTPIVRIRGGLRSQRALVVEAGKRLDLDGSVALPGLVIEAPGSLFLDGILDAGPLGQAQVQAGTFVTGTGTLFGGLILGGEIRPAGQLGIGTMTIDGGLTMQASARIDVDASGTGAGQFDQIALADNSPVVLDGTIRLRLQNGFVPALGDVIRILSWPSGAPVSGAITSVVGAPGTPLPDGLAGAMVIGAGGLDLVIVETPDPCVPDIDGDGIVGFSDVLVVLAAFDTPGGPGVAADVNGDGTVGFPDLLVILAAFGVCP